MTTTASKVAQPWRACPGLVPRFLEDTTAEKLPVVGQEHSKPIVDALHGWLTVQLGQVSGKSSLAEAIRYALCHWLVLFLEDGRLELNTNISPRTFRQSRTGSHTGSQNGECRTSYPSPPGAG